ncbi:MAG TPA: biosynthetic peptidoglycan transglycosylase [Gemmatimonadales bacterium]|nr:biosynthetic peptidoglycan transglycosylase [Gemmatimonadales bacterium]
MASSGSRWRYFRNRSRWWWFSRSTATAVCLFVFYLFAVWPPPLWYRFYFPRETAFMAMRRDQDPARAEKRKYDPVPLTKISRSMQRAVLVAEDHRFYEHGGFDWIEFRKALGYRRDSFDLASARDRRDLWRGIRRTDWSDVRGASTITQQLAKNLYLSPSRNPLRKVKEAVTTVRLEIALPKARILELYLNTAELGDEIWGVEAASRAYFGRSAARLTNFQAASLAGTLPHPRSSNPNYKPGRMAWRRNLILGRM